MNSIAYNTNHPSGDASSCIPCLLSVWLGVQLAALGLGAAGVELSARWPRPAQQLSLHEMLAVQVIASSLLFPWLMRSGRASIMVIATSLPMSILAAALAESSNLSLLAGSAHVTLWLATLAVWSRLLRTNYLQLIGVLIASCISLGGAVLWYLAREFANEISLMASGTLVGAMHQIDFPFSAPSSWALVIGPLIIGAIALRIAKPRAA